VTLAETFTKGGGGSVDAEEEDVVESGSEKTMGAAGREEIFQDDVTPRLDVEAQESREGHRFEVRGSGSCTGISTRCSPH
jgi:hypothetical protein